MAANARRAVIAPRISASARPGRANNAMAARAKFCTEKPTCCLDMCMSKLLHPRHIPPAAKIRETNCIDE